MMPNSNGDIPAPMDHGKNRQAVGKLKQPNHGVNRKMDSPRISYALSR
jgi:hypothetical protein